MNYTLFVAILILIVAGWYAWHYYTLRGNLRDYARLIRQNPQENPGTTKELEGISSAVSSLISAFGIRYSILDDERSRLATVLDQITDGVLIADAHGLIQFANPASGRLFQFANPVSHSIVKSFAIHRF